MGDAKKIRWWAVEVFDGEGRSVGNAALQRDLMREYRDTKAILGYWLADPRLCDEYGEIDGVELSDCGPTVDEIDFTNIDD